MANYRDRAYSWYSAALGGTVSVRAAIEAIEEIEQQMEKMTELKVRACVYGPIAGATNRIAADLVNLWY